MYFRYLSGYKAALKLCVIFLRLSLTFIHIYVLFHICFSNGCNGEHHYGMWLVCKKKKKKQKTKTKKGTFTIM